jgi:hypothetical protein
MAATIPEPPFKYMSGNVRHQINQAIQQELAKLPQTIATIEDPVKRLEFLIKFMPYVCSPIKHAEVSTAREEVGENDIFYL